MSRTAVSALQLLGAVLFAGACIALALSDIDLARLWPVWFTIFLFGPLAWYTREFWRRKRYWTVLLAAFAIHSILLLAVEKSRVSAPLLAYVIIGTFEATAIVYIVLVVDK